MGNTALGIAIRSIGIYKGREGCAECAAVLRAAGAEEPKERVEESDSSDSD